MIQKTKLYKSVWEFILYTVIAVLVVAFFWGVYSFINNITSLIQ